MQNSTPIQQEVSDYCRRSVFPSKVMEINNNMFFQWEGVGNNVTQLTIDMTNSTAIPPDLQINLKFQNSIITLDNPFTACKLLGPTYHRLDLFGLFGNRGVTRLRSDADPSAPPETLNQDGSWSSLPRNTDEMNNPIEARLQTESSNHDLPLTHRELNALATPTPLEVENRTTLTLPSNAIKGMKFGCLFTPGQLSNLESPTTPLSANPTTAPAHVAQSSIGMTLPASTDSAKDTSSRKSKVKRREKRSFDNSNDAGQGRMIPYDPGNGFISKKKPRFSNGPSPLSLSSYPMVGQSSAAAVAPVNSPAFASSSRLPDVLNNNYRHHNPYSAAEPEQVGTMSNNLDDPWNQALHDFTHNQLS